MSKKKYLRYFSGVSVLAVVLIAGCSKGFLDKAPLGTLVADQINNKDGLTGLLNSAYAALDGQGQNNTAIGGGDPWQASPTNWIYGSIAGGDAHKGSSISDQPPIVPIANAQEVPSNGFFNNKWRALYEGVTRCNKVLSIYGDIAYGKCCRQEGVCFRGEVPARALLFRVEEVLQDGALDR